MLLVRILADIHRVRSGGGSSASRVREGRTRAQLNAWFLQQMGNWGSPFLSIGIGLRQHTQQNVTQLIEKNKTNTQSYIVNEKRAVKHAFFC